MKNRELWKQSHITPELQQRLRLKYPVLLSELQGTIDCGSGWEKLIDCALDVLDHELKRLPNLRVLQIKAKCGELRIYTTHDTPATLQALNASKLKSAHTCEVCGDENSRTHVDDGWAATICDRHAGEFI